MVLKERYITMINVAQDFSRFPAGRYTADGPYSGERFREQFLVPAMNESGPDKVTINFDGARGYGSSFLEEAFGGLIRVHHYSLYEVENKFSLNSSDPRIPYEIRRYWRHANSIRLQQKKSRLL